MIKVLIVDDHKVVREGIISLIADHDTITLAGEASNGLEALERIISMQAPPDVVLMDINMPVMDGIECTAKISKDYPSIKVLILTMIKEGAHIKKMLEMGAYGYVLKNCDKNELVHAIEVLHNGNTYYSKGVTEVVMKEMVSMKRPETSARAVLLSKREIEVLKLITSDLSNYEISKQLHISPRTVETHKHNLLRKTQTKSLAGLAMYAVRHKIITI